MNQDSAEGSKKKSRRLTIIDMGESKKNLHLTVLAQQQAKPEVLPNKKEMVSVEV